MKLDPTLSLAINLHSSKGIYALILGSGVSRSARIPTGWEVVVDLIERIAKMQGANPGTDPAAWYKSTFGEEADYAKLLDAISVSPEQRQQILRSYFEPDESEREQGFKQPTHAHRAIARLVVGGYIRVILTTNFDHLMETSLRDAGVTPVVLSTSDAISGAVPLMHQRCVVVKIHGDYLDTRIKNTPDELDQYEPTLNDFLDRVFDDFGLIIAGWSGEYDTALRRAILRAKSRRYGFYWTSYGEPRETARTLIEARGGLGVKIAGADEFFTVLADKVSVLDDLDMDHPISVATAVALTKRYLGQPKQLVRLDDLFMQEAGRSFDTLSRRFASLLKDPQQKDYSAEIENFLAGTATLRAIVAAAAFWDGPQTLASIERAIVRIGHDPEALSRKSGVVLNDAFRVLPAMLVLYAAGISLVARGDFVSAASLMKQVKNVDGNGESKLLLERFSNALSSINAMLKTLPQYQRNYVPLSDLVFERLGKDLSPQFADPPSFETAMDEFELLMAMIYADNHYPDLSRVESIWTSPGRYVWKYDHFGLKSPLFVQDKQGDEITWCKSIEPFQRLIAAGHFRSDWSRLVKVRRAAAENAGRWTRG